MRSVANLEPKHTILILSSTLKGAMERSLLLDTIVDDRGDRLGRLIPPRWRSLGHLHHGHTEAYDDGDFLNGKFPSQQADMREVHETKEQCSRATRSDQCRSVQPASARNKCSSAG